MARLSSGRNGSELLRVEREEANGLKRMLSFMSKGPVLVKTGRNVDGAWMSTPWKLKTKRDIGVEMIKDVKSMLEANGWRVVFYGQREFQKKGKVRTRRNDTRHTTPQAPRLRRRKRA